MVVSFHSAALVLPLDTILRWDSDPLTAVNANPYQPDPVGDARGI